MFERLIKQGAYSEDMARRAMRDFAKALAFLHA